MTDIPRKRGFARLSPEKRREIARLGRAKSRSGFEHMPAERLREVASSGARTTQQRGLAHRWTPDEAAAAGRKGGRVSRRPAHRKEAS